MNKFKKVFLDNNIPLYICCDPSMKNIIFTYNVNYGHSGIWFNFNNDDKCYSVSSGYAHFLEHILLEHSKYGNLINRFQVRSNILNAYTAMNLTYYLLKGDEDILLSIEEMINSIENPVFNKSDVKETSKAIEEEASNSIDDVVSNLSLLTEKNLYGGFDLYDDTLSCIGNRKTTKNITMESLYDCYNAFYGDNNKYLVIAGNIEEDKIIDYFNDIYSRIKPHKSSLIIPNYDYDSIRKTSDILYVKSSTQLNSLGIKIKKPDDISKHLFYYCINTINNNFRINTFSDLNNCGIIESIPDTVLNRVGNYMDYMQIFMSKEKNLYIDKIMEELDKKEISKYYYNLIQKGVIADTIRIMEDKYDYIENFSQKSYYSEDYSDIDFYKSIDYNTFMDTIYKLDFSNYTTCEMRQTLKKNN